jgi:hypothetical protein
MPPTLLPDYRDTCIAGVPLDYSTPIQDPTTKYVLVMQNMPVGPSFKVTEQVKKSLVVSWIRKVEKESQKKFTYGAEGTGFRIWRTA